MGRVEEAIQSFSSALNIVDADDFDTKTQAFFQRGISYGNIKNHQKLVNDFDEVIKINPTDSSAFRNRALGHLNLENWGQALADYSRAVELNSEQKDHKFEKAILSGLMFQTQKDRKTDDSATHEVTGNTTEIKKNLFWLRLAGIGLPFIVIVFFISLWCWFFSLLGTQIIESSPFWMPSITLTVSLAVAPLILLLRKVNQHWSEERKKYASLIDYGKMNPAPMLILDYETEQKSYMNFKKVEPKLNSDKFREHLEKSLGFEINKDS